MKKIVILTFSLLLVFHAFSDIRIYYLWDDFNQFYSEEGTNVDLTVELGDTIQWLPLSANPMVEHTITSTNIPIAAGPFDYQWNPPADVFFQYIPTELGLHEFECSLHVAVFNMVDRST